MFYHTYFVVSDHLHITWSLDLKKYIYLKVYSPGTCPINGFIQFMG